MKISSSTLVNIILATILLTSMFFISITSSTGEYDPWLDYNEDGYINIKEAVLVGVAFGTQGDPTKNVTVTNWPDYTIELQQHLQAGVSDASSTDMSANSVWMGEDWDKDEVDLLVPCTIKATYGSVTGKGFQCSPETGACERTVTAFAAFTINYGVDGWVYLPLPVTEQIIIYNVTYLELFVRVPYCITSNNAVKAAKYADIIATLYYEVLP